MCVFLDWHTVPAVLVLKQKLDANNAQTRNQLNSRKHCLANVELSDEPLRANKTGGGLLSDVLALNQ